MPRRQGDWESLYKEEKVENLPWYYTQLDTDLKKEIKIRNIKHGRFLDLGTGPGTQAAVISKSGFEVTGIDISKTAIKKAKKLFPQVNFMVDNILKTKIPADTFDYIFDRGCFHTLPPRSRQKYVRTVTRILHVGGILFLKCFSSKEKRIDGPYKFSSSQIMKLFEDYFEILDHRETVFETPPDSQPKALFFVMLKK
jgi:ubiquinone/menaquinone biosynthesis C-methylase UbiE